MNTWVVGNAPIGHYSYDYRNKTPKAIESTPPKVLDSNTSSSSSSSTPQPADSSPPGTTALDRKSTTELAGEKTFFMKGRIMAGQANLDANKLGLTQFRWLTKGEIQGLVSPRYWAAVRNMLVDR